MINLWEIADNYRSSLLGEYDEERGPDRFQFTEGIPCEIPTTLRCIPSRDDAQCKPFGLCFPPDKPAGELELKYWEERPSFGLVLGQECPSYGWCSDRNVQASEAEKRDNGSNSGNLSWRL